MGFPWANLPGGNALHAWDFLNNTARWNSASVGALSNTPGWTFTRASTGYAQNAAGVLLPFATGELRRTDKGVLIEGARTNLCLQSQTFDNASWTKSAATVSADAIVAPDGTTTADKIVEDATSASHTVYQSITLVAASVYTWSVYAKAGERTWLQLNAHDGSAHKTYFDLANGVVGTNAAGNTAAITALANGWYRCTLSRTAGVTGGFLEAGAASADNTASYAGDITKGLYVWGAQIEAAAFPSSYIPTTTASATRAADSLSITGVTGLEYPLSLFCEFERAVDTGTAEALVYLYINGNNYSRLSVASTDAGQMSISAGGVTQANLLSAATISVGAVSRLAGRVASNDARMALNGVLTSADASVTFPVGTIGLYFGADGVGATPSFGYLRRTALFNRAISDAELQALTL